MGGDFKSNKLHCLYLQKKMRQLVKSLIVNDRILLEYKLNELRLIVVGYLYNTHCLII